MWMRVFLLSTMMWSAHVYAEKTDPWRDLGLAAKAVNNQSFSGLYLRQTKQGLETYQVYRLVDKTGLRERRVANDGIDREVLRHNRQLQYFSDSEKGLKLLRLGALRQFPPLLPTDPRLLDDAYVVSVGAMARVANRACRWYHVTPKRDDRYRQDFCLDSKTYFPLKQVLIKNKNELVEQNTFSQITYGAPDPRMLKIDAGLNMLDKGMLPPTISQAQLLKMKQQQRNSKDPRLSGLPPGFVVLVARELGKTGSHYLLSDALVKVSVFVESTNDAQSKLEGHEINGGLSMGIVQKDRWRLTAVGDVPSEQLETHLGQLRVLH
ncbi:MAG: MucB/RseB C-terminal domain-containing protein [Neisseriaceae bacterium]|nr:MucB/RseB C-terminal domain-containing protein [Neisseriaceae bacterium]